MKIYFIGQKGIPCLAKGGGVERHVENLAQNLKKIFKHKMFVYSRWTYSKKSCYKGIKIISLPTLKIKTFETPLSVLLASLHVLFEKPDIIHYQGIGPSLFIWIPKIFLRNIKVIATIHCQDYYHQKWGSLAKLAFKIGEYFACRIADQVIVVSQELKEYIKEKYNREVIYIPHPLKINKIRVRNGKILKKLKLKPKKYFLFVGRFVPHKKIDTLIKAFKKLPAQIKKEFPLVIVGGSVYTDSYLNKLKQLAKNENIIFTGWLEGQELDFLYKKTLCFVQPSLNEGSSLSLIEAAKEGIPIIARNLPCNREILGNLGIYFNGYSSKALIKLMKKIIKNRAYKDRGKALRRRIIIKFNPKKIASKTNLIYHFLNI